MRNMRIEDGSIFENWIWKTKYGPDLFLLDDTLYLQKKQMTNAAKEYYDYMRNPLEMCIWSFM